jgi:hypothetical protein
MARLVRGRPLASMVDRLGTRPEAIGQCQEARGPRGGEHHLVVIIAGLGNVPFHGTDILLRDDPPLPTTPLVQHDEITRVWVMSMWSSGHGIRWSSTGMWQRFDKLIDSWNDST